MVIAKQEWFKNKKGTTSIFNMPLKGLIYIIITGAILFIGVFLPQNIITGTIITLIFLFLLMDMNMASLRSMDEREHMHYSIAMRNMAWGMLIIMITGATTLLSYFNGADLKTGLYILIIITGIGGFLINIITRHQLEKEN
jgi:hypothetical protein